MFTHPEKLRSNKGFTLIETLVALVILTMAVIPLLTLAESASQLSADIRNDMVAAGLAQEGVEIIHAIRDTNWFSSQAFDNGLAAGSYQLEWNSVPPLTPATGDPLNLNNGVYTYSGGTATIFTRTVTLTNVSANEIKVVSTVTWPSRGNSTKTISVEDHLFNWK